MSLIMTDKLHCANCAIDRSIDLLGVCDDCNNLYLSGEDVKIKETMDKDIWSCGCRVSDYSFMFDRYNCPKHEIKK